MVPIFKKCAVNISFLQENINKFAFYVNNHLVSMLHAKRTLSGDQYALSVAFFYSLPRNFT